MPNFNGIQKQIRLVITPETLNNFIATNIGKSSISETLLEKIFKTNDKINFELLKKFFSKNINKIIEGESYESFFRNRLEASIADEELNLKLYQIFNQLSKIDYIQQTDYDEIKIITQQCYDNKNKNPHKWYNFYIQLVQREKNPDTFYIAQVLKSNPDAYKFYKKLYNKLNHYEAKDSALLFRTISDILIQFDKYKFYNEKVIDKFTELKKFIINGNYNISNIQIAQLTAQCFHKDSQKNEINFLPKIFDFIKVNIKEPHLQEILDCCRSKDYEEIEPAKLSLYKKLREDKISQQDIKTALNSSFSTEEDFYYTLKTLREITPETKNAITLTNLKYQNKYSIEYFQNLYRETLNRKSKLEILGESYNEDDIKYLLYSKPIATLNTIDFLGEKTFFHSFENKYEKVMEYITDFGFIKHYYNYEKMVEIINPTNSLEYKKAINKIKKLKEGFLSKSSKEKECTINEINQNNLIINNILSKSIKDPKIALDYAHIYKTLWRAEPDYTDEMIKYLNFKNNGNNTTLRSFLNQKIFELIDFNSSISSNLLKNLNFTDNKYLHSFFNASKNFKTNFKELLEILNNEPEKEISKILNALPQNIETKAIFEDFGINYNAWTNFNPESYIQKKIYIDIEKARKNAIKNLELDLASPILNFIPLEEKIRLFEALQKEGFQFGGNAFGEIGRETLHKNNKPIHHSDLIKIIKIIRKEMEENSFWNKENEDKEIESLKNTIKKHILEHRYKEISGLNKIKPNNNTMILTFSKANMNDISHALFLGNHAGCCTAIGATKDWTAPSYIINRFISCIEVKDGDNYVGNTMCYFALVNGVLSLILDNIELKSLYRYNDSIKSGIIEYAEKLCAEVGVPNIPIFAGPKRHKIHLDENSFKDVVLQILGKTSDKGSMSNVYLDFDTLPHTININEMYSTDLYKLR